MQAIDAPKPIIKYDFMFDGAFGRINETPCTNNAIPHTKRINFRVLFMISIFYDYNIYNLCKDNVQQCPLCYTILTIYYKIL